MAKFKRIIELFSKSQQSEDKPIEEPLPENDFSSNLKTVDELTERLFFVHKDQKYQDEKRSEAYEKLGLMGAQAKSAIPALIDKSFVISVWERNQAGNTLRMISQKWYLEDICNTRIDFLIKNLLKDMPYSGIANEILSNVGLSAQKSIIGLLKSETDEYKLISYIKYLKDRGNTENEFLAILEVLVLKSENSRLLAMCLESLGSFSSLKEETKSKIYASLSHSATDVRLGALKAIKKLTEAPEPLIIRDDLAIFIFRCLSDDSNEVANHAVDILGETNSLLLEKLYETILFQKGKLSDKYWGELIEKIELSRHRGETGHWLLWESQLKNDNFWRGVEFRKLTEKPFILLANVLKILVRRPNLNSIKNIARLNLELLAYFEGYGDAFEILENCIKILGEIREGKDKIIPGLLVWLGHPQKRIRDATVSSLDKLEENWLNLKESADAFSMIITKLDSNTKFGSRSILLELGEKIVPFINDNLYEGQSRIVLLSLIDILDRLDGSKAIQSLDTLIKLRNSCSNNIVSSELDKLIEKLTRILENEVAQDESIGSEIKKYIKGILMPKRINEARRVVRSIYEYDVALSFASENRDYVEKTAIFVKAKGYKVFYDKHEQANLWGKDLYQHLSAVYTNKARYCIIFISKQYAEKLWTKHELRNAQARAFEENREYILPVRFDDSEIPGLNKTIGYIDLRLKTPHDLANIIVEKLK